jgi:hypothetical protein
VFGFKASLCGSHQSGSVCVCTFCHLRDPESRSEVPQARHHTAIVATLQHYWPDSMCQILISYVVGSPSNSKPLCLAAVLALVLRHTLNLVSKRLTKHSTRYGAYARKPRI